jgi:hypothetical protein
LPAGVFDGTVIVPFALNVNPVGTEIPDTITLDETNGVSFIKSLFNTDAVVPPVYPLIELKVSTTAFTEHVKVTKTAVLVILSQPETV